MVFTTLGRVVAILAFVFGLIGVLMGLAVPTGNLVEPEPGYYLGTRTSGEAIDRGIYKILFAIILGVLTDISRSLAKSSSHVPPGTNPGPLSGPSLSS